MDTPGGYATWKYGFTILLIAIWPLLACSRMLRGEEERGSLDVLLSLPRGRVRVALEKLAAVWTALLGMGLLIGLLTFAGGKSVSADFGLGDALLFGLNVALICGVFGSHCTAALPVHPGARHGVWHDGRLAADIYRAGYGPSCHPQYRVAVAPLPSLLLQFEQTPGARVTVPILGPCWSLLALSILLSGAAIWLFARRDIGGTVAWPGFLRLPERAARPERALPENAWSLRSVYTRSLGMIAVSHVLVDAGHRGVCRMDGVVVKQTETDASRPCSELTTPEGCDHKSRRE